MFSENELVLRLIELYRNIDSTYAEAAEKIGLVCEGCDGAKCCTVDLTLHTFMEIFYLRRGLNTLEPAKRLEILGRCHSMIEAKKEAPYGDRYRNAVCAVNTEGTCMLYEYRPMICRLAGIPHFITRPDGSKVESGGCERLQKIFPISDLKIDRTEFYQEMARMEVEAVRARGRRTKKLTVAEALASEFLGGEFSVYEII
jgi:Fe-S-cluster containining protein